MKKRHLPHLRFENSIYFVTSCIKSGSFSKDEQLLILEHLKSGNNVYYILIAAIIMSDHIHILLYPKEYSLSRITKGIKGVTARKINLLRNSSGALWQDESYDRIIFSEDELNEKLNYMLYNPVKKGYEGDPLDYYGWYFNGNYIDDINK